MSILFATPYYGGMTHLPHTLSYQRLFEDLQTLKVDYDFLPTGNESLIQRARNTSTAKFMRTEFQKLMFIDGDIEFEAEAVASLWNLDVDVAAGAYRAKTEDVWYSCWKDGRVVRDLGELETPTEVDYAATGFMMIDRTVFEKFRRQWPGKSHIEGQVGECFAWFDPRVSEGERAKERIYLSEDYAFCHDWKSLGGRIFLDPSIKLVHHGMQGYAA